MKKETKEEVNKHLEGLVKYYYNDYNGCSIEQSLEQYQKKHNLIPSIEVGKWYKGIEKCIIFIDKITNKEAYDYGFTTKGEWCNYFFYDAIEDLIPETKKEVESMLLEKAKKDYPKGTKFKTVEKFVGNDYGIVNDYGIHSDKCSVTGELYIYSNKATIYYGGKWASIVEEVKTEETFSKCYRGAYGSSIISGCPSAKVEETEKETVIRIPEGVEFEFKVK